MRRAGTIFGLLVVVPAVVFGGLVAVKEGDGSGRTAPARSVASVKSDREIYLAMRAAALAPLRAGVEDPQQVRVVVDTRLKQRWATIVVFGDGRTDVYVDGPGGTALDERSNASRAAADVIYLKTIGSVAELPPTTPAQEPRQLGVYVVAPEGIRGVSGSRDDIMSSPSAVISAVAASETLLLARQPAALPKSPHPAGDGSLADFLLHPRDTGSSRFRRAR